MASVVAHQDLVKDLFVNTDLNPAGVYGVNLFIRGKPWTVLVDDIFLFIREQTVGGLKSELKHAKVGDDASLWAAILEKAWAKVKGSYQSADFGLTKNGIRALTGAPTTTLPLFNKLSTADKLTLFENVKEVLEQGYLVVTQTPGSSDTKLNAYGVPEAHAYTVMAAFEIQTKN
jgi:hypothetical protein